MIHQMDEGYIKFKCIWEEKEIDVNFDLIELNTWIEFLKKENLIGVYDDGICFGNVSCRNEDKFIITGTQTAHVETLYKKHFALVKDYNIESNEVTCVGQVKASSESLSHAAIYEASPETNVVVHIHSKYLWDKYMNEMPTTDLVPYGTPAMAKELIRLVKDNPDSPKIIIMAGHEEGVIVYGKTLKEACLTIMTL